MIFSPGAVDDEIFQFAQKTWKLLLFKLRGIDNKNTKTPSIIDIPKKLIFLDLSPSTKTAIIPLFFEQIEKFQYLKSSTAPGLSHGTLRCHVTRVTCPETCLKVCQL